MHSIIWPGETSRSTGFFSGPKFKLAHICLTTKKVYYKNNPISFLSLLNIRLINSLLLIIIMLSFDSSSYLNGSIKVRTH